MRVLQEYLTYISGYIPEIPAVPATGYFGTLTQQSVIAFQRLKGLPQNGVVGAITWDEITRLYSDLYNGSRLNDGQYPGFEIGST